MDAPNRFPFRIGRRIIRAAIVAAALATILASSLVFINPGNVGVLIHRVRGGVDPRPLGVGFRSIYFTRGRGT